MKYTITAETAGERLDKFLLNKLPEYSRSKIQKLIKDGSIRVSGKEVAPHYFLKDTDSIQFVKKEIKEKEKLPVKARGKLAPKINLEKIIIADNDEFMVINKPAGIAVHGDEFQKEESLADLLVKKYPTLKKVGDDPYRPGIVHRLDKDVSGVMIVAKTQKTFDGLKRQFMDRKVEKTYLALVYGKIDKDAGTIDFPIERSREGKMAARPANQPGKVAITDFKVIRRFINYTLLEAKPKTGRTHQIRCHLAAYGAPIVGDNLYGTKETREKNKKINLGRIFLAAVELTIRNSAGEQLTFRASLPKKLKDFLKNIK